MFNPVIIGAIVGQSIISQFNRMIGAIVGYVITTGILIWGIGLYNDGYGVAFFGNNISQEIFIVLCLAWYGFNTWEFIGVKKVDDALKKGLQNPVLNNPEVVQFYQTTMRCWAEGQLNHINSAFQPEGKNNFYEKFVAAYPPFEGSALDVLFRQFSPKEGEFMVGIGDDDKIGNSAWFILTNQRLIQRDGISNNFREIKLEDIQSLKSGSKEGEMTLITKSGGEESFSKLGLYPKDEFITKLLK
ncbi:MAG: hypothetical protein KC684_06120 [Candidatus Omnitrophica bacterium]|nr:hypothetical protein [Candidatus Omnitrophota bacterium]